ncbi:hypothetical protein AB0I81_38065 [Nonomuraea sp. NPDC050404]|uniref:hypothetical protein n=1 Tax=Nonomuraea sp. NPDC050404 TaxID=3155783 RepID=UPI0033ED6B7D
MELFDQPSPRRRVTISGALRLARLLPILDVLHTPFLPDLRTVVSHCDAPAPVIDPEAAASDALSGAVTSLRQWRARLAEATDVALPSYYQSTAAGIALLVATPDATDPRSRFARINAIAGNFWNCCDDIVHRAGGFRAPPLRTLKTTLRGVEDLWFNRDLTLLAGPADPHDVLEDRLRELARKGEARREVAELIAHCAGWPPPDTGNS